MTSDLYPRIYAFVRAIPKGRVSTYGQVADIIGCGARQVGYALSSLPADTDVPWQRVLNHRGQVSLDGERGQYQIMLLEHEGIRFDLSRRVDLERFGIK